MKFGSKVHYVDEAGNEHAAHVTEVTGTGKSLYKVLSLSYRSEDKGYDIVEDVPHENDVLDDETGEATGPHWREVGAAARRVQVLPTPVPGGGVPSGVPFTAPFTAQGVRDLLVTPVPGDPPKTAAATKRKK